MIQLLQSLGDGTTHLIDAPVPAASAPTLVVETRASVISAGTERMLVDFGKANLLEKARRQPEKVRQVVDKIGTDGLLPTLSAVRSKLDSLIPLGYCHAGVVMEKGSRVDAFTVGDRVVTNGPHAEYVRVVHTLAARIPASVPFESAAFTPLAAIGLQGLRLANPTLGETVVVYGLGVIGLLTVQLARAAGCRVIGIDRDASRVSFAEQWGAKGVLASEGVDVAEAVSGVTGGDGVDIVLLTLATESSDPIHAAATMARKRGRIVLVGVAGLALRRDDFYRKELSFQVSCSYGPGRYDPTHEEKGVDYPAAFVRWTEGRNFEAVLQLMAEGGVDPMPLISHRFAIADAAQAYELVSGREPSLGIVLTYPPKENGHPARARTVALRAGERAQGRGVVGWIGAGNFASRMLIPAFVKAGAHLETIASAGGVSASTVGAKGGFRHATTDTAAMLTEPAIDTIVITTRHDSHADWVTAALGAGKHVFVEKPLAVTMPDLDRVRSSSDDAARILCVGFNRRFAPMVLEAKRAIVARREPLAVSILVNAGEIPQDHWTQDRNVGGGRIVGEACHFIDLARYLVGSSIASLDVRTARRDGHPLEDIALLQIGFEDGSLATVQYLANGSRSFPKERIELFFERKTIRIDNYRKLSAWGIGGLATRWPRAQDKGHAALAAAFVNAVRSGGKAPIPLAELLEVSEWSIRAAELAVSGGGTA
ncbi:MAG: bi-domain-containing oxidoreductase [Anaerolineae bacterium]|nr:bi-domain-containing oxidoreductase [Gemmatimonadaceae bacterium]